MNTLTRSLPQPRADFIAKYAQALQQAAQFARQPTHTPAVYYRQAAVEFARQTLRSQA